MLFLQYQVAKGGPFEGSPNSISDPVIITSIESTAMAQHMSHFRPRLALIPKRREWSLGSSKFGGPIEAANQ